MNVCVLYRFNNDRRDFSSSGQKGYSNRDSFQSSHHPHERSDHHGNYRPDYRGDRGGEYQSSHPEYGHYGHSNFSGSNSRPSTGDRYAISDVCKICVLSCFINASFYTFDMWVK